MMLWPWQKITIGLMRVSVHHWRRLCSHWNCNNAQMIETLLYSLQGYPQVLETGVSPALCQTFLLWGTSKHGKVFDGEVPPIDQSGGAICGVGTLSLAFAARTFSTRFAISNRTKSHGTNVQTIF